MFLAMHSRRRGPSRRELCGQSGCKCVCHEPRPYNFINDHPLGALAAVLMIFVPLGLLFALLASIRQAEYAKHPPVPYYCSGITSTGAPTDCHPAILSPDVLKQYEDHFKK